MPRTETRFGYKTALGSTYESLGTVASATTLNLLLNVTNSLSTSVKLRAYIADGSWASGEPTGSTLIVKIAADLPVPPGSIIQISGNVLTAGNKLVVWADTGSALDIIASGVSIT